VLPNEGMEYETFVAAAMSPRRIDYHDELHRVYSFKDDAKLPNVIHLAITGYYWSSQQRLCCISCDFSVDAVIEISDLTSRHRQYSQQCVVANHNGNNTVPASVRYLANVELNGRATDNVAGLSLANNETEPLRLAARQTVRRGIKKGLIQVHIDLQNPDYDKLKYEIVRLSTYTNWPPGAPVTPADLARNALFYTGELDKVRCVFCRSFLSHWEQGDDVATEHRRHFPNCDFVKGLEVGNEPIDDCDRGGQYVQLGARRGDLNDGCQGRRHGFESGGYNFASGASEKNFLTPPPALLTWGGHETEQLDSSARQVVHINILSKIDSNSQCISHRLNINTFTNLVNRIRRKKSRTPRMIIT
jgi:hypothetical protein